MLRQLQPWARPLRPGKESEVLVYNEDELISRTEFPDTGKIQTLYSNGRELAVVYYKPDNRTVDRIEYR